VSPELTRKEFLKFFGGATVAACVAMDLPLSTLAQVAAVKDAAGPNIKWSYMDHWSMMSARGRTTPFASREYMDQYMRQLAALGFTGFDTFSFRLAGLAAMFGSLKGFEDFLRDHRMEKLTGVFVSYPDAGKKHALHDRANQDTIVAECQAVMESCKGLSVESFIVMPGNTYWQTEPVTNEKIKNMADLWTRIGKMTWEQYGIRTACHHEFWCSIRTPQEIEKFYQWTDPQYVYYWCDTAQTVIAGQDPTELYNRYYKRTAGFHMKDTHNIDTKGEYRLPPDPEMMAPSVKRWFWEMGAPGGLVDFPKLMNALKQHQYRGWLAVEHDKVEIDNGSFAESTCIAKWYIENVLAKIYA
jgi:inosose dehydratase